MCYSKDKTRMHRINRMEHGNEKYSKEPLCGGTAMRRIGLQTVPLAQSPFLYILCIPAKLKS
jgi:hypothetical protein